MTAPTVFEVGHDGQSHVINENPSTGEMPAVEEAITNCPAAALWIEN